MAALGGATLEPKSKIGSTELLRFGLSCAGAAEADERALKGRTRDEQTQESGKTR
jgi:hypothetical protein